MTATAAPESPTAAEVRAWAREVGHSVGARGRFADSLLAAFTAATGKVYVPKGA